MQQWRAGSKQLIRELNQAGVLNAVRTRGPVSRTDIAALTNLSLPTISAITAELIEDGLIYEQATGTSSGGRKPVLLALNPRAGFVVGIKLTESAAITALTDLEATIVAQHSEPIGDHAHPAVIAALGRAVDAVRPAAGGRPIFGVGLGLGGVIHSRQGLVRHATYLGWRDLPLQQLLEQALDLPVVIDNDVNALTAAEQWFGAGRNVDSFLVISLGRGIGMGMVLDNQIYRGAGGGAGEFGHTTIVADGPLCACGKRGCLEALISDPALLARVAHVAGSAIDMTRAVELAMRGDAAVQSIFSSAGRTLGMAVANLVNVLNPELLIVGGEGTRVGPLMLDPFEDALRANCFDSLRADLRVVTEPWGDEAWARGAASLMLGALFRPALRRDEQERPTVLSRANL